MNDSHKTCPDVTNSHDILWVSLQPRRRGTQWGEG
jgi:hypothetical protein